MTRQLLPFYRDFATKTIPSGRETFCPLTGTFAKTITATTLTATNYNRRAVMGKPPVQLDNRLNREKNGLRYMLMKY